MDELVLMSRDELLAELERTRLRAEAIVRLLTSGSGGSSRLHAGETVVVTLNSDRGDDHAAPQ